jgi:putative ABC transport system permease protein
MVVAALIDHFFLPRAPEVHRDRTLEISYMNMRGPENEWNGNPGFGFLDRYCRNLDGVEMMSIAEGRQHLVTYREGERVELELRRTDGTYWSILDFDFLEGAPFTSEDDAQARPVAVISEAVRRRFFRGGSAVGRTLELAGKSYDVVGVVRSVGPAHDFAYADVWAPIGTMPDEHRSQLMGDCSALLLADSRGAFRRIRDDFRSRLPLVEFPDPESYDRLEGFPMTRLDAVAAEILPGQPSPSMAAAFVSLLAALALAFMALPAVNLVNVNLSRIYERMSEIGVRKAFGAASSDLVRQFVLENVMLCLVAGVIGFVFAGLVLASLNASALVPHSEFAVNLRVFLAGMALAVFFGVLSGWYPAWRMSRLHPVIALRGGAS